MFKDTKAFSSFSVDDLEKATEFYGQTLGLDVEETPEGLVVHIAGGTGVFIYPSDNYTAPKHTVLNSPWTTSTRPSTSSASGGSGWSSTTCRI
jgi:catechol 2,3-dioxygenase-like lactoylglutathione lyase family enzyme